MLTLPSLCAICLVGLAASILIVRSMSQLNIFLRYGKTLDSPNDPVLPQAFDFITCWRVPKSWFAHFYILSSILCLSLWMCVLNGSHSPSAILYMYSIQSARRLWECYFVETMSPVAKMHVFHYAAGLMFYLSVGYLVFDSLNDSTVKMFQVCLASSLFSLSSHRQYTCHRYLASLVKYSLPQQGLFKRVACPHYLYEVLIYFSFWLTDMSSVLAWATLLFTAVNLSVSAEQTKIHYCKKFGSHAPKYAIFPGLF